jgi:endogenous inhibitor of DNA gyrase (YacG/DUF329 family)
MRKARAPCARRRQNQIPYRDKVAGTAHALEGAISRPPWSRATGCNWSVGPIHFRRANVSTTSSPDRGVTGTFQALMGPGIAGPHQPLMTRKTQSRLAPRRDSLVTCVTCGRKVERQMRKQEYCSPRCRDLGRGRCRKKFVGQDTGAPATPTQRPRVFNDLDWVKRQSSSRIIASSRVIQIECFAGRLWQDVVSPHGVKTKVTRFRKR